MKRFSFYCFVAVIVSGCAQQQPTKENSPVPPDSQPNSQMQPPTNSTPPTSRQPASGTPNQPQTAPTSVPSSPSPASERPKTPQENPAAAPPKAGEQVAKNFKIEMPDRTFEVEGVCKLTEDEAICWKPSGDKNEALAAELTNAIKSKSDEYSSNFQFKFMKKNRILVLKTTIPPPKPGQGYRGGSNGSLMNDYRGGPGFTEGWTNNYTIFNQSSSTGFDQSRIERQVLTGAFEKETKTFPLRYQLTNYTQDRASIPFQKGPFTIDGNTYEIVSISDKPDGPHMPAMNQGNSLPQKYTFLQVKAVKITNPYSIITLGPSDDSGAAYGGLDDKGNPISQAEAQKMRDEEQKKMMEASQSGKPYNYNMSRMNRYINSFSCDPSNFSPDRLKNGTMTFQINVEPSKIKKLVGSVSHRTVFVFDKIKLDKN